MHGKQGCVAQRIVWASWSSRHDRAYHPSCSRGYGRTATWSYSQASRILAWHAGICCRWSQDSRREHVVPYSAPIRHRGVVAFAARRAKELGADVIILLSHGTEYAGTISGSGAKFEFRPDLPVRLKSCRHAPNCQCLSGSHKVSYGKLVTY